MKSEQIKVGAKSKSARAQIALNYRRPEDVADCLAICEGNESAVAALFNRGYTIWLQDRFGRPMFEENAPAAEIQEIFMNAVPGVSKGHSQARSKEVVIPKGQSFSPSQIAELLAKQGIKVVMTEAGVTTSTFTSK
jgi:hypothetical protein